MTYHESEDSGSASCRSRRHRHAHRSRFRRSSEGARKERVLHTRVSEQLSDDIRRFAEDLRVPASNLVRNVLEEVFTMVDHVSDDVGDLLDDILEEAEGVRDRVRNQSRPRPRRGRERGRRRGRSGTPTHADLEEELPNDETAERDAAPRRTRDASRARDRDRTAEDGEAAVDAATDAATGGDADRGAAGGPDSGTREVPPAAELFPEVLGWQPLVLNRDFECGRCTRALGAGESAFLGLSASGLTEVALCGRCAGRR